MTPNARILVVDDEPAIQRLLCGRLEMEGYECKSCGNVNEALEQLRQHPYDLVLSDMNMPGKTGMDLLREVRAHHPGTGFLMATALEDVRVAVEVMKEGANEYLVKPLSLAAVTKGVKRALDQRIQQKEMERSRRELESLLENRSRQLTGALQQLEEAGTQTLQALALALDTRSQDVAGHSQRVSRYCVELARIMGYKEQDLARLERSAYLHDIGKLAIPDAILLKPSALTPAETEIMRGHVNIGYDLVSRVQMLASAAELVLTHQERFDGKGYPRGLKGEAIPLDARIFAVADALDAMTSDRPYRSALSWQDATAEIHRQAGKQFDPSVVAAFKSISAKRWIELQTMNSNHP